MFYEETPDVSCMAVTAACSEGALGTWRSQSSPRTRSRDKAAGNEGTSSWVNQRWRGVRMSVLEFRHVSGKTHEGKPGSEPERGNPAFRDRRGACGIVEAMGAGLRPTGKPVDFATGPYGCVRAALLSRPADICRRVVGLSRFESLFGMENREAKPSQGLQA